jgi:hypothetical protein
VVDEPLEIKHPSYMKMQPYWEYYSDHYEGGPSYPSKLNPVAVTANQPATNLFREEGYFGIRLYLWQYTLETNKTYQHRLVRALPVNIVAPVIDLYCSTIGKQENVLIDAGGLEEFLDNCNLQGESLLEFMGRARANASTRGHTFIVVDSTRAIGPVNTQADALSQGIRPYVTEIVPEDLYNWRLDSTGQPTEILYRTELEVPGSILEATKSAKEETQYRFWSKTEWRIYRKDNSRFIQIDGGVNTLGRVPVVVLYHKRAKPFMGISLIKDAAKIQQLLCNWASGFDEALEKQLFAQPVLTSKSEPSEVGVGISTVLHLNPEENEKFEYVCPQTAPFESGWDAFYRMAALANKHMGIKASPIMNKESTGSAQSGVSKAWDFYEADKIMCQMALHEQEAVKQILDLVAAWKSGEYRGNVQYSTKYDLATVADDIADLLSLQMADAPVTGRREVMRRILSKKLPSLPLAVQKQIDKELEVYGIIKPSPIDLAVSGQQPGSGPGVQQDLKAEELAGRHQPPAELPEAA